jgi:hypothetical protein
MARATSIASREPTHDVRRGLGEALAWYATQYA